MHVTQNPIGSDDQLDLQDNAISFDYAMNSPAALWQDRFGKQHKTVQQALKDVGFKPAGFDFVSGGTLGIGDRDKCVFYPTDGYWYSWNGKLPYVVPANSSPTPGGKKGWGVVERETKLPYKTPEDFTGTVQERIVSWLNHGGFLYLDKSYTLTDTIKVSVSDTSIFGPGELCFPSSVNAGIAIFEIVGNKNKINGITICHEGDMLKAGYLLALTGDDNKISESNVYFETAFNPTVAGQQYKGTCINITGDRNVAENNRGKNGGGGVTENGKNNTVRGNIFDDCCRVVTNGNKSRYGLVDGNSGNCNHKGFPLDGCDGIWGNRSHRFTVYRNNVILNAGEHGAYLQGDGFVWDETNRIEGSQKCMIKVGAKVTENYAYPGETLPTFNKYGIPDVAGGYSTTGARIAPRGSNNNLSGASDGVVCLQPNIADIVVDNYEVVDNPLSPAGIRSVYFSGGTGLQVMANLRILAGKVLRSGPSIFACIDNLEIKGFYSGREITITGYAAPDGTKNVTVDAICPFINFSSGPSGIKIIGGKYRYISEASGLNIKISNVEITNQEVGGFWDTGRVLELRDCDITWNAETAFNINGVDVAIGNTFNLPNVNVSYALQYNHNSQKPSNGHFDGNTVKAPLSTRPLRLGGFNSTCNNNTVTGSNSSDYNISIQGVNVTVVGNNLNYGVVRLESATTKCFVVARSVTNDNPAGNNIAITS